MTWTPPDIAGSPEDDPVVAAVARQLGLSFRFEDGRNDFRRVPRSDDPSTTREVIAMKASTPMGRGGGYAQVCFGRDGAVFYRRKDGRFEVTMSDDLLPQTVMTAARDLAIGRLVDVPGIGHWPIASVVHNEIDGDIQFHLTPTAPEEDATQ